MENIYAKGPVTRELNPGTYNVVTDTQDAKLKKRNEVPKQEEEALATLQSDFEKQIADGNEEAIKKLADGINRFMDGMQYSLQFVQDREAGQVIVKVLDGAGKVIRRIPPEDMAALSSKVGSSSGLLFNEKVV